MEAPSLAELRQKAKVGCEDVDQVGQVLRMRAATENQQEQALILMQEQVLIPNQEQALIPMQKQALIPMGEQALIPMREQALIPMQEQALILMQEQAMQEQALVQMVMEM